MFFYFYTFLNLNYLKKIPINRNPDHYKKNDSTHDPQSFPRGSENRLEFFFHKMDQYL